MTLNEKRAELSVRHGKDYGQVEGDYGDVNLAEYVGASLDDDSNEGYPLYLCEKHAEEQGAFLMTADKIDYNDVLCDFCRIEFHEEQRRIKQEAGR